MLTVFFDCFFKRFLLFHVLYFILFTILCQAKKIIHMDVNNSWQLKIFEIGYSRIKNHPEAPGFRFERPSGHDRQSAYSLNRTKPQGTSGQRRQTWTVGRTRPRSQGQTQNMGRREHHAWRSRLVTYYAVARPANRGSLWERWSIG